VKKKTKKTVGRGGNNRDMTTQGKGFKRDGRNNLHGSLNLSLGELGKGGGVRKKGKETCPRWNRAGPGGKINEGVRKNQLANRKGTNGIYLRS